jgi:UTP--glucose-1-phosphate uridylyltransferase
MPYTTLDQAAAALTPFGYDPAVQARFAALAAAHADNAARGELQPLPEADLARLPALGTPERRRLREAGLAAIAAGRVGVIVLAGGMATRFGGVVKAVVPARGEASFLQLKHEDVARVATAAGARVPTFVMSSFATHAALRAHVAERLRPGPEAPVSLFPQRVALRLTPAGELFRDGEGHLSPYATGHGDLPDALRGSGLLRAFREAGGTTLLMSNVDNLGATLDPALVGLHLELGGAITVETVRKDPGDAGGAPALLGGVPQIIEGFRFPKAFDQARIGVFNTNTLLFEPSALDQAFELPYYRVEKKVEGAPVIQFERLVGELTAFVPSRFVEVPRTGEDCRFIAVKEPADLGRQRALVEAVTRSTRGVG